MTYATVEKLILMFGREELVELTDRADPPAGRVDQAVAVQALQSASNKIDGYVGAKYPLPLAEIPALLVDLCCDIARFNLFDRKASEEVRDRYNDAIKTLEGIAKGLIKLQVPTGAEPPVRDTQTIIQSEPRRFSRSSMEGL